MKVFSFDLLAGSKLMGDKAHTDYVVEDTMNKAQVHLTPVRKKN